jgi:Ni/Fe-hydrogenase 1 B-type cytochrome subunit
MSVMFDSRPSAHRVYRLDVRMGAWRRIIHWANALSVVAAVVTGIYIANPFYGANYPYVMAWNRTIHLTAATVMDVGVIVIAYLYFFSRVEPIAREQLRPTRSNLVRLQEAFLNVLMLNRRKQFDSGPLDPLNALLFVLLHLMVVFQLLTGLQLYVVGLESGISSVGPWWPWIMHFFTDWTQTVFGGIGGVRVAHHVMMYPILAWAIVHIYYEVWRTVMWKEGDITISFGGYKYAPAEPE